MNKIFFIFILAGFFDQTFQADWSYDYETQWPGVCRTGLQQSPINIMTRDALLDHHGLHIRGPLVFTGYERVNVSALNNGHTLRWNVVPDTPAPVLSGGPLRGNYTLLQFHLHWLSEHAIDSMKYPLEIHMVHIKAGISLNEALDRPDGLAVIGVLCRVFGDDDSKHALEELIPVVPDLLDKTASETSPYIIDMTRIFSPDMQSFYTYQGSLTTPYCQEVVTWIVMDKTLRISDTQYRYFSRVNVGGIDNYRSLQAANRVVYRSVASCSSIIAPNLFGFLLGLISCFASKIHVSIDKSFCALANIKKKLFGKTLRQCEKVIN